MTKITLQSNENSISIEIPPKMLAQLKLKAGDTLYAVASQDSIQLIPYNSELAKQIKVGEEVTAQYSKALKKLAE